MRSIHHCGRLLLVVALFAIAAGAQAQGYPNRPVRLVVADAAGGAPDQLAACLLHDPTLGADGAKPADG